MTATAEQIEPPNRASNRSRQHRWLQKPGNYEKECKRAREYYRNLSAEKKAAATAKRNARRSTPEFKARREPR